MQHAPCAVSARVALGMPVQHDEPWGAVLLKLMGKDGHDLPGVCAAIVKFF